MLNKVIWTGPRSAMESLATFFSEGLYFPPATVGLQKIDKNADDEAENAWSAEVYLEGKPDIDSIEDELRVFDHNWRSAGAVIEGIPDKDWVTHSLEGLGLVEAGRFVLYGVHDKDKVPNSDEKITIRIDANQAFGTGHHPTTEGCLTLLDRFAGFAPKSILDLGCGSAVLAIAAAKLWGRSVLATDIDEASVDIANDNAALNGVADKVTAIVADGFNHEQLSAVAPFDFVFANILAGPLKEFAPEMARHLMKNGRIMLAGLMAEQRNGVVEAYGNAGFRLINQLNHDVWPVLLLVRE